MSRAPAPTTRAWLGQALRYLPGALAPAAAATLLVPLSLRVLGPAEFGALELLVALNAALLSLLPLGLPAALVRAPAPDRPAAAWTASALTALIGAIALGLVSLLGSALAAAFGLGADGSLWLRLTVAGAALGALGMVPAALLRARGAAGRYSLLLGGQALVNLALTAWLLLGQGAGVTGALLGTAGAALLGLIVGRALAGRWRRPRFERPILRDLLSFGLPLVPATLAIWALNLMDRYLLAGFADLATVGLYGVGYRVGMVALFLLAQPASLAWPTFVLRLKDRADAPARLAHAGQTGVALGVALWLGLSLLAPELVGLIAPPEFAASAPVVPWVAAAYVLYGWQLCAQAGILLSGRSTVYARATLCALGAHVVLLLLLVGGLRWGALGAAMATLGGYGLLALLTVAGSQRLYRVPYDWTALARLIAGAGLAYGLGLWLPTLGKALLFGGALLALAWHEGWLARPDHYRELCAARRRP